MNKSESYIIVYDWMAEATGNSRECNVFALLCSFAGADGAVQLSRGYIAHRISCDIRAVDYTLKALLSKGLLQKVSVGGAGRSDATTYKVNLEYKNLYPKIDKKSTKICTLKSDLEYKKLYPKRVQKFVPNNKQLLNNTAIAANAPARAGDLENNFSKFWDLFQPAQEYQDRQRACREQWGKMDEGTRGKILQELSTGKPNRANPLFYLLYYGEQPTTPVKLTMNEVYKRYNTTAPAGYCILVERDLNGTAYWCKTEDAKRAGWQIQREFN